MPGGRWQVTDGWPLTAGRGPGGARTPDKTFEDALHRAQRTADQQPMTDDRWRMPGDRWQVAAGDRWQRTGDR